jgi:hypothetical protein
LRHARRGDSRLPRQSGCRSATSKKSQRLYYLLHIIMTRIGPKFSTRLYFIRTAGAVRPSALAGRAMQSRPASGFGGDRLALPNWAENLDHPHHKMRRYGLEPSSVRPRLRGRRLLVEDYKPQGLAIGIRSRSSIMTHFNIKLRIIYYHYNDAISRPRPNSAGTRSEQAETVMCGVPQRERTSIVQ